MAQELQAVLSELRSRIRWYVAGEGSALVLVALGLCFWGSFLCDFWLEWPRFVRFALLLAMVGCVGWTFFQKLLARLGRDLRDRGLALVLERRFPALGDRLITTVELAEKQRDTGTLGGALLERTVSEVRELAGQLKVGEALNHRPLARAAGGAALLLVSVVAFAAAFGDYFGPWYRRNVLLADELYPRRTRLELFVVAEPGERRLPLTSTGSYKHPRGADFTLLAVVPEGGQTPDEVRIAHRLVAGGSDRREYLTRFGEREFRITLPGLSDSLEFRLRGGDYSSPAPVRVDVVDPPRLDEVVLQCLYPAYTGRNRVDDATGQPERVPVAVQGTQVSLPAGTDFVMVARVNKPLVRGTVRIEPHELLLEQGTLSLRTGGPSGVVRPLPVPAGETWGLSADGLTVRIPWRLATAPSGPPKTDEVIDPIPATGDVPVPVPLASEGALAISLEDTDGIISPDPIRLSIQGETDQPPSLDVRTRGIGNSITRQARIPVVGTITDDFGVRVVRFDAYVDAEETARPLPLATQPQGLTITEFPVEGRYEVLPLELTLGQKLTLAVTAADGDTLTGPHERSTEKLVFSIVSNDELLALVAAKELNLRRRFEQILDEVRNARKDMLVHRAKADDGRKLRAQGTRNPEEEGKLTEIDQAVSSAVERVNSGLLKNENELMSVELSFRDIRDEIENNAVPDMRRLLSRLDDGIVGPLHEVNEKDLKRVRDGLGLLRLAVQDKTDPLAPADVVLEELATTIRHLEAILAQMVKLESYNEAVQLLRDIIKLEKELREKTERERKKSLLE
jgi:hypothetical protein